MSKFKKGDKVKIRKDLAVGDMYGGLTLWAGGMAERRGETAVVVDATENDSVGARYRVDGFWWAEDMLEPVEDAPLTPTGENANYCVCCGAEIPEGRQVCPACESGKGDNDMIFKKKNEEDAELGAAEYARNIGAMLARQCAKGMKKYGESLEDNATLSRVQRIEHIEEEMIDGLQYCEHLKKTFGDNLTVADYQRMAMRTANPECHNPANFALGLAGEAGECADIVKKHLFQGHELDKEHLAEELGDVAWYIALAADTIGISMEEILQRNVDKLKARYPDGFDKARSINRKV